MAFLDQLKSRMSLPALGNLRLRGLSQVFRLGSGRLLWVAALLLVFSPLAFWWIAPEGFWESGRHAFAGSMLIFWGLGFAALSVAWRCQANFDREAEIVGRVLREVDINHARLQSPSDAFSETDITIERYILAGEEKTLCARIVQEHHRTASAMRNDQGIARVLIDRELHPIRMRVRPYGNWALRAGILMTFIGLLVGMQPVADALKQGASEIPVGELMSGLTISFATSIAGLAAALVINLMVVHVDQSFDRLVTLLERLSQSLGTHFAYLRFGTDLTRTVDHLGQEINRHAVELEDHATQVGKSLKAVIDQMRTDAAHADGVISAVALSHEKLSNLEREHSAHVTRLAESAGNLRSYEEKWAAQMDQLLTRTNDAARAQNETLAKTVAADLDRVRQSLVADQKAGSEALIAAADKLRGYLEDATGQLQSRIDDDSTLRQDLTAAFERFETTLQKQNRPQRTWPWVVLVILLLGIIAVLAIPELNAAVLRLRAQIWI